jgi:putative DNA methylase
MKTRKKLIEVALPLDAINKASAREKSIGYSPRPSLPDRLTWAPATRSLLEEL